MKITPHKADCQRYNGVMKAVITPEIAENLHQVGDRWTLLILRDLFLGRNRFETLKAKTGAGRATLTRRLQSLIAADIVGKSLYSAGRYEYLLTTKGRDLFPAAMLAWQWEIKHLPIIEGELPPSLVHSDCGNPFEPIATCEACNQPLLRGSVALMPDTLSFDRQVLAAQSEKQRRKRQFSAGEDESMVRIADLVGDRWSILILVAMFFGLSKYDEFLGFLGIATNVLGQRLNQLVSARVVRKEPYQNNPVRYRYLLSERGEDLYGFIMAVWQWAKCWTPQGEAANGLLHSCGEPLVVGVNCSACQKSLKLNV
jgi:DNA-binding HxlR family transcriptional regulator